MTESHSKQKPAKFKRDPLCNQANLMAVTQNVFDAIISSADQFPSQLRSMCHCLYQVSTTV